MKRVNASLAFVGLAYLSVMPLSGGNSLAMAQEDPHLTTEQAITAARRNAKAGNSLTILAKSIANTDTRRIGDQALEQAHLHKIELFENGMLVDILQSGGYLLAETDPQTNNVVATHVAVMAVDGAVKDIRSECHGPITLADAGELVKDTSELVKQMYSTPSTEELSLAIGFYGGKFPDAAELPDSLFTIPHSLRKSGAKQNEVREAAALFWGYLFWPSRSALSMPAFSANPAAAGDAAEKERETLKAEFLKSNHMEPDIDPIDFDNIHGEKQLQRRIALLTRLNRFLEDSLRKKADPAVVAANLSILSMPLSLDVVLKQAGQYVSSSPPKSLFLWHRVATSGFAVSEITWDW